MTDQDDLDHHQPAGRDRAIAMLEAIIARDPDKPLQPHEQHWFIDACRALVDGQAKTLEHALGLKRPGDGRGTLSPTQLVRLRTRNRLIRIAAELLARGEDTGQQGGILAYLLEETDRGRRGSEPSAGEQFLHTADVFMEVPRSDTQLGEILKSMADEGAPGEKSFSPE